MLRIVSLLTVLALLPLAHASAQAGKKNEKDQPKQEAYYLDEVSLAGLKFRTVGPATTSGRISDFAVHPQNAAVYYVAVASGGVWKTINAGTTFEPIFDGQGSYSIGCVTLDPGNPNVVWVGTGENNNQRSVAYGDGVYKSMDGGQSWTHMGLKTSEHISKIIVDPRNSDVVYLAAYGPLWKEGGERGVYKTTDGGKTWSAVLTVDDHTGACDLVMDPRNPDVLYASMHQRRRHVFTYIGGGPSSALYKSTNGGQTWEKINKGLPEGDLGRIGLAISPADPEILYAIVEATEGKSGFYKSTNRGASWVKQSGYNTSGNYYQEIVAHPTKPDKVFAMDVYLQVSTDGGKTFKRVGEQFKHVDNHCMWIDPAYPDHYLVGCDGGIYESFDAGATWDYKPNLPVTQFYKVAVDNSLPFYYIYGGTQDNFSLGGPSRNTSENGIVNSDWFVTNGGDGFESQIDPNNPNIVYAQSQYGGLVRYDRASGEALGIQPKPREGEAAYRWNWDAPLAVSSHLATRIYFAGNKLFRSDDRGNTWEVISPDLSRQIDRNTLPVMGRIWSVDAVAKNGSTSPYGAVVAFSESPLDQGLLFAGTDDGLIQITENGGSAWTKIESVPGVPERTYVNALLASQHDKNVVYAAFNNHKNGDFKPYMYISTDKGRSWTNISANLPERGSVYSVAEDHVDPNLLFVGTEFGVFFSNDRGKHWKALKAGLPTIAVRDIAIQKRENDLVLGTFGRGFYVLDDYSPLRSLKQEELAKPAAIFPIKDGLVFVESSPLGIRGKGFMGHSYYSAPNPPVGVAFTYFVKDETKSLQDQRRKEEQEKIKKGELIRYPTYEEYQAEKTEEDAYLVFTIRDIDGNIVRKLQTKPSKGVNRIVWDGRQPSKRPVSLQGGGEDNVFSPNDRGIMVAPGQYTVSLSRSINGELTELVAPVSFKINVLGGATLAATDRQALEAFHEQVAELERTFRGATANLSDLDNRLRHIRKAVQAIPTAPGELLDEVSRLEMEARSLRQAFFGDDIAVTLDKDAPYSIASRIYDVVYESWGSTAAPTTTHREAYRIANSAFQPLMEKLRTLRQTDLAKLESRLEELQAPYTPGRF